MKRITNIRTLATLLMASAAIVSCSVKEDIFEEETTIKEEPAKVYTLSVNATKGGDDEATKALSLEGKTLNATWSQGDAVEVWTSDGTTTKYGTLTAETSGASTKLKGTLSSLPSNGQSLLLKYLSPAYATQDGTLTGSETSIDRVCDYATATVTATVAGSNVTATDASFVNQQAVLISVAVREPAREKFSPSRLVRRLIVARSLEPSDARAADQTTSQQWFVTVTDVASSTAPLPAREPMASTSVQNESLNRSLP